MKMKNKKILVTGADDFIGTKLTPKIFITWSASIFVIQ